MKYIEIKTNEFAIHSIEEKFIITNNLDDEIAFTCFSSELSKAGMARSLTSDRLIKFFQEFKIENAKVPIHVKMFGGDESDNAKQMAELLVKSLLKYDAGRNVIDIIAYDVCSKIHPNSVIFSCSSGLISNALDAVRL